MHFTLISCASFQQKHVISNTQVTNLLKILPKRGAKAFDHFLEALENSGNDVLYISLMTLDRECLDYLHLLFIFKNSVPLFNNVLQAQEKPTLQIILLA